MDGDSEGSKCGMKSKQRWGWNVAREGVKNRQVA